MLAGLTLVSVGANAGPPYVTDDPETSALRGWEINVPFTRTDTSGVSQTAEPLFDINYGLRRNLELTVDIPIAGISGMGATSTKGIGDSLVGFKWRFHDETRHNPQIAVSPQALIPTGSAARGLGAGKPAYYIPILAEKNWGNWTSFSDVGYAIQTARGSCDYWYYGVAVTREINRRLMLGSEVYGNTPTNAGSQSLLGYNFGLEWELTRHCNLLASAGHSLHGDATSTLYVGLQFGVQSRRHHRERAVRHPEKAGTNQ